MKTVGTSLIVFVLLLTGCAFQTVQSSLQQESPLTVTPTPSDIFVLTKTPFPAYAAQLPTDSPDVVIQSVDISSDKEFFAIYKSSGAYIYDLQGRTSELLVNPVSMWHTPSSTLAFSPTENILAISQRNFVELYNFVEMKYLDPIKSPSFIGYTLAYIAYSPDGEMLLLAGYSADPTFYCWVDYGNSLPEEKLWMLTLYDVKNIGLLKK